MGKKSQTTTTKTVYGNTTTTNPFVTSSTTNGGTVSKFNEGTAFDSINNFVNANMNNLLYEYLNPTLNSVTNQAKLNSFINNLNAQSVNNLENNIINPLSKRNMIRSSQATNLYNNMLQNNNAQIADYTNELLANSQTDTAKILNNLLLWYLNGYGVLSDTQSQSLATSQGNATNTQNTTSGSSSLNLYTQLATQLALRAAGL